MSHHDKKSDKQAKVQPPVAANQVNLIKLKGNIFEDALILKMLQERNFENMELHKSMKIAKENMNKLMVEYNKIKRERDDIFAQASVLQNQYFTLLETSANAMSSLNLKVEEVKALNNKISSLENIKSTLEAKVKDNQVSQAKSNFQSREINRLNKEITTKDMKIKSLESQMNSMSVSSNSIITSSQLYIGLDKEYIESGRLTSDVLILDNALLNPTHILNDNENLLPLNSPLLPLVKKLRILILSVIGPSSINNNNTNNKNINIKPKPRTRKQKALFVKTLGNSLDNDKQLVIKVFQDLIDSGLINSDDDLITGINSLITKVKELSENFELINKTKNYLESLAIAHQEQICSMKSELSNSIDNSTSTICTNCNNNINSNINENNNDIIPNLKRARTNEESSQFIESNLISPNNELTNSNSEIDPTSPISTLQPFNFIEPSIFSGEEIISNEFKLDSYENEFKFINKPFHGDCLFSRTFSTRTPSIDDSISTSSIPKMYISDESSISHALNLISDSKKVMNSELFSHFTELNSTNLLTFFNSLLTLIRNYSLESPILDSTLPSTPSDLETIVIDDCYRRNLPTQLLLWERKISIYLLTLSIKFPKLQIVHQLFQLITNLIVVGCQAKEDRAYTISLTRIFTVLSLATQDMFSIRSLIYDLLFFSVHGKNLLAILANIAHIWADAFTLASNTSDHVYLQTIRAVTASIHAKMNPEEGKANICYKILIDKAHFPRANMAQPLNAIYTSLLAQLGSEFTDNENHPMLLRCISLISGTTGFDPKLN